MMWPGWLWIGTRTKFSLWLGNRIATWTGSFVLWKRWRGRRRMWMWLALLNVASLTLLALVLFWLHVRRAT